MKTNELMLGDWVIVKGVPTKIHDIDKMDGINREWIAGCEDGGCTCYEDIQPIPLTPEILDKNGFNKGDIIELEDEVYCVELFNIHYDNEERQFWVCNFFESEYGTEINDIFQIKYVHELQHALRLCKIEKEIVL